MSAKASSSPVNAVLGLLLVGLVFEPVLIALEIVDPPELLKFVLAVRLIIRTWSSSGLPDNEFVTNQV